MRRPEFLARQGRCPSGFLGAVIGRIMAHETVSENAAAVNLLQLQATEHVLEVGFGHGRTVAAIARRVSEGFVAGVDTSEEMLRLAGRFNLTSVERGLVELKLGDSSALPYSDRRFDKALAVHTIYFWQDPVIHFREFARVLRQGGMLVLGFRPAGLSTAADFPSSVYRFRCVAEICRLLSVAGFPRTAITESRPGGRPIVFVSARQTA